MTNTFLPISSEDAKSRGWDECDVVIVTGDAYVDHPSYGAALIGRVLLDAGFRTGIIAQPNWNNAEGFKKLGRAKLFFAITAGNLDSMVANFTASRNRRKFDDYSPGGRPLSRPDRSTIIYANRIREAFPDAAIVIGGMEASLRRLAHYDYWSDTVRRSILIDSKADILVYGDGVRSVPEIARRLRSGTSRRELDSIKGTVVARNAIGKLEKYISIPSYEETVLSKNKFAEAFKAIYDEFDPLRGRTIVQRHDKRFVIQYPPADPLDQDGMDEPYDLPYVRRWHDIYDADGGVPGFETVKFSIISHRGCPGECSFCSLYLHQGRIIQSRSPESIIREAKIIASQKDFKGTITDIGGPTANLYAADCPTWHKSGGCLNKKCLVPSKCTDLKLGYDKTIKLWREVLKIPKVKHLFIGSGVRYDLLIDKESDNYLRELCAHHISGRLKVAPEHSESAVLGLMNKPPFNTYEKFVRRFDDINKSLKKEQYLVNYLISSHPGSGLNEALKLALELEARHINPEQIQDFLPLPMTISGAMYYSLIDPFTGKHVYTAKGLRERKLQRALAQHRQSANKKYVLEALKKLNKMNLAKRLLSR